MSQSYGNYIPTELANVADRITGYTSAEQPIGTSYSGQAPAYTIAGGLTLTIDVDGTPQAITLAAHTNPYDTAAEIQDLVRTAGGGTAGTSTSGSSPATTATGLQFSVNINGDGAQQITVDDRGTHTGAAVAAAIQVAVRALIANNLINQEAIATFTCTYTTTYNLTSGSKGPSSTVVVSGGGASTLKLGVANGGTEVAGAGTLALDNFSAIYDSGLNQLILTSGTVDTAPSSVVVSAGTAQLPLKLGQAFGGTESYTGHEVIVYRVTYLFVYKGGAAFGAGVVVVNSADIATPTSIPEMLVVANGRAASVKASLAPSFAL